MIKPGFVHSPFKNAVPRNRPIVIEGLDEKLKEHYENWARMEKYLVEHFDKENHRATEVAIVMNNHFHEVNRKINDTNEWMSIEFVKIRKLIGYVYFGLVMAGAIGVVASLLI